MTVQGEYMHSFVNRDQGTSVDFGGGYVSWSWFFTGESRPYDRTAGVFGRLKPRHDLSFRNGGLGAWELVVRYSRLDLDDDGVRGGKSGIVGVGMNWFWNRS
jgi:phosphate-selective porin OprO and OprP